MNQSSAQKHSLQLQIGDFAVPWLLLLVFHRNGTLSPPRYSRSSISMGIFQRHILHLILFFILCCSSSLYAANLQFIPNTLITLPEESIVKIQWILAPHEKDRPPDVSDEHIQFAVDADNNPLITYKGKILFSPLKNYVVQLKQPIRQMICFQNGALIFTDGDSLLHIDDQRTEKTDIPRVSLKPITTLPLPNAKIFQGDGNSLYAVAYNVKTRKHDIFLFNHRKVKFDRLFSSSKPIQAITGTGTHVFVAIDNRIEEYLKGKRHIFYEHPRETLLELYFSDETGVFYKTKNGVGFVKNGKSLEFLQSNNPKVFLKGANMFVFFSNAMAVLELTNLDDLKNYSFSVLKVVDINKTF
jgi:hypothetical protein